MAEQLQVVISGDATKLIAALRQSGVEVDKFARAGAGGDKATQGFNMSLGGLKGMLGTLGVAIGAREVVQYGLEAVRSAEQVERLSRATENMARNIGSSGDQMVAAIQDASLGMIDHMTAVQAANKAMMFGIVGDAEEMQKLTSIAVTLGAAMGVDAATSIDNMSVALGRQSRLILDNLGIIMDETKAQQMYAEQLGKTVDQLTEEEKAQSFVKAALAAGEQKMTELGGVQLDSLGKTEQLKSAWMEFSLTLGGHFAPAAESAKGTLLGLVQGATQAVNMLGNQAAVIMQATNTYDEYANAMGLAGMQQRTLSKSEYDLVKAALQAGDATEKYGDDTAVLAARQYRLAAELDRTTGKVLEQAHAYNELAGSEVADERRRQTRMQNIEEIQRWQAEKSRETIEEEIAMHQEAADSYASSMESANERIRGMIENVMQPTLDEVWKPPEAGGGDRIDEWARRLATVATQGFGSEWLTQLSAQFGGMSFWQPIADAMAGGDEGALKAAATQLLSGPGVTQLWDKELIKQKVREQLQAEGMREELMQTIMAELSGEGLKVEAGQVQMAMGGPTGGVITAMTAGVKADDKGMAAFAGAFASGFTSQLPGALGAAAAGNVFVEALAALILSRVGAGGEVRP